jgi:hypothetical protein
VEMLGWHMIYGRWRPRVEVLVLTAYLPRFIAINKTKRCVPFSLRCCCVLLLWPCSHSFRSFA